MGFVHNVAYSLYLIRTGGFKAIQYGGLAVSVTELTLNIYGDRSYNNFYTVQKIDRYFKKVKWVDAGLATLPLVTLFNFKFISWTKTLDPRAVLGIAALPVAAFAVASYATVTRLNKKICSFQEKTLKENIEDPEAIVTVGKPSSVVTHQSLVAYRIFANLTAFFFFRKRADSYLFLASATLQVASFAYLSRCTWIFASSTHDTSGCVWNQSWYNGYNIKSVTIKSYIPMLKSQKMEEGDGCAVYCGSEKDVFAICGNDPKHVLHAECVHSWMKSKGDDILNNGAHLRCHISMDNRGGRRSYSYTLRILKGSVVNCPLCRQGLGSFELNATLHTGRKDYTAKVLIVDQLPTS